MVKVFLAPGLLAHIRKSIVESIRSEELMSKDDSLNELIQRYYATGKVTLWGLKETLKGLWRKASKSAGIRITPKRLGNGIRQSWASLVFQTDTWMCFRVELQKQ